MKKMILLIMMYASWFLPGMAHAFCGFYVAKADTRLFNRASKVVLMRDADRTVITMANDYQGELKEFAIVIPVPTVLQKDQIHIANRKTIDHLDAYTSPRLVEYFDSDPCRIAYMRKSIAPMAAIAESSRLKKDEMRAKSLGVKIEAKYTVGEYDILLLSAKQSNGLQIWLKESGYKIPQGASSVLESYIKQDMKFFVARVNLKEQSKLGYNFLRPIQVAFESPKFMLPIRLGTLNAKGDQELFVFALTRSGRVETSNYRTVKLPSNFEIPEYTKQKFSDFYRAMFAEQVKRENHRAVFLEYAWNMNWCDPCAADPLSNQELRELGVYWLQPTSNKGESRYRIAKPANVYVTRLHVRYSADTFPDDLRFQVTGNTQNFQGRYIIRHPWKGDAQCEETGRYQERLRARNEENAKRLANMTGWDINEIRRQIRKHGGSLAGPQNGIPWWKKIWN